MKIALIGYGKMGKAIEEIANETGNEIVLKVSSSNKELFTKENIKRADVAIEFTNPNCAVGNIKECLSAGVPVVSGTTGWLLQWDQVKNYCNEKDGTFLYASNFSIGVNLFFELNKYLAALMSKHSEYHVNIEETHHAQKKDAPSGTAITLAEQIMQKIISKKTWVNQETKRPEQLEIISKRVDDIPGTHRVLYDSLIDNIEIIHTAHNRKGFAAGALQAAAFIRDKKGIFSMQDVLGL
jgi:4-hydroxy-tetrahydrodipicolinate reductase